MIQLIQLIQPPTISNRYPQDPARIPKLGASCVSPNPISPQSSTRIPKKFGLRVEKMVLLRSCLSGATVDVAMAMFATLATGISFWGQEKYVTGVGKSKTPKHSPNSRIHSDVTVTISTCQRCWSCQVTGHSPAVKHGEVMWSPMAWFLVISSVIRMPYHKKCQYTTCQGTNRRKPWIDHHDHPNCPKFLVRLVLSCSERKSMAKTAQLVESGHLMFQRFQR